MIDEARESEPRQRWRSCLHEAAHAVAFRAHGVRVAFITLALCQPREHSTRWVEAVVCAAGPAAEKLADRIGPPEGVSRRETPAPTATELLKQSFCEGARLDNNAPSDDRVIALYAIWDCEDQPEGWQERVNWVRTQAGLLVERHAQAIVDLAGELFRRGWVDGDRINRMFSPPALPAETLTE